MSWLNDEYSVDPGCSRKAGEVNTSLDSVVGAWPEWIEELGPPVEGAEYYDLCIYRPQEICLMGTGMEGFCPVCMQQTTLKFFANPRVNASAPIEATSPEPEFGLPVGLPVEFSARLRLPSGPSVTNDIVWTLQGPDDPQPIEVANGVDTFLHAFPQPGLYTVNLQVVAGTNFVKPVKTGQNRATAEWAVTVCTQPPHPGLPDADGDGVGDVCDVCPNDPLNDDDLDGRCGSTDNCPMRYNPLQADTDVGSWTERRQWADWAFASSEWSATDWSAMQATGSPESAGQCLDLPTSWAPLDGAENPAWLELVYALPVRASGLSVGESLDAPFVDKLELRDGDGAGDACDCAPADATTRRPAAVTSLAVEPTGAGTTLVSWAAIPAADSYAVSRGLLSRLGPNSYGVCLETGLAATSLEETESPPPGDGFFYLVRADSVACGHGSSGFDSSETERTNLDPAGCP